MAEPFTSQPDVDITARSSSYDKNIQKIIDLNRRLRGELEGVKSDLESMNEEFDKASQSIDRMIASLRRLPGIKGRRASGGGISFDSDIESESNPAPDNAPWRKLRSFLASRIFTTAKGRKEFGL